MCCRHLDSGIEVADHYWPYEKQAAESGAQDYVARIRKLLTEPACVRCRFSTADEKMTQDLYTQGVSLAQVERPSG